MRFSYLLPDDVSASVFTTGPDRFTVRLLALNDTVALVGTQEQLALLARQILSVTEPEAKP